VPISFILRAVLRRRDRRMLSIAAVLEKGEERTAFLREAIEREIERREAAGRRKPEKRKHRR